MPPNISNTKASPVVSFRRISWVHLLRGALPRLPTLIKLHRFSCLLLAHIVGVLHGRTHVKPAYEGNAFSASGRPQPAHLERPYLRKGFNTPPVIGNVMPDLFVRYLPTQLVHLGRAPATPSAIFYQRI